MRVFPTSYLYRSQIKEGRWTVVVHEGFISAPAELLQTLMSVALDASGRCPNASEVRGYAQSEAFAAVRDELLSTVDDRLLDGRGQYHDLSASFDRVNHRYFDGSLEAPALTWSRTRTARKLGHYDEPRDLVQVSQSLDSDQVPAYVVDYVVYHELLHKVLGTEVTNGRRYAHTGQFRTAEAAYEHYEAAQEFLSHFLYGD
jgi:hypothetical protein